MNFYATAILLLMPVLIRTQESSPQRVHVETKSGPVEGLVVPVSPEQAVNTFYGIPYAQPPVGNLRFQPPAKVNPWTATLKAEKPLPSCYQQLANIEFLTKELRQGLQRPWSEDCLTLNIWTPSPKPEQAPVFVFIHGGGFIMGSSLWLIDGTTLALEGFVVVTMNYRLGVFGFFNLGVGKAPGNVGLMDQNLALHWIQDNIEAFGGDPHEITLAGMSAGSASVGYHLLSAKSSGLFKRAIMMSGSPINFWATMEPERSVAKSKSLSEELGCPSQNTTLALDCLKHMHPEDILDAGREKSFGDYLVPSIDGDFITEHPSVTVSKGNFNPGEVIVGTAVDEGADFMKSTNKGYFKTGDGRLERRDFLKVLKNVQSGLSDLQLEALNVVYTKWSNPDDPLMLRDAAKDIYSDSWFVCRINEFAESLARAGNPVYRYVFDHKMEFALSFGSPWHRAVHGFDQLPILGPFQLARHFITSPTDILVSRRFLKQIINFARHGDPNLSKEEFPDEPPWPQYTSEKEYNFISATSSIRHGPKTRECAVWLKMLPLLGAKQDC